MKSTVVIPNYNGMEYLRNCLLSLQACVGSPFAVLVIDNASTDGSQEMVTKEFPEVTLIGLSENYGFAKAVNIGIEAVETQYVILLNNDTTVEPNFVNALENGIESSSRIFSVSAKMIVMSHPELLDGAGDLYCALGWAFALGKGKNVSSYYNKRSEIFSSCGGAAIYRMSILREIGLFDEHHFAYLEDTDIGYRAKVYGYKNYYEPKAVVYHAGSASSGSRYNLFKINLAAKNSIYLIFKNMPVFQIIINIPCLILGFSIKILFFAKKGYGKIYLKGIWDGINFCKTKEAKQNKLYFKKQYLLNYVALQIELWINMVRRICG